MKIRDRLDQTIDELLDKDLYAREKFVLHLSEMDHMGETYDGFEIVYSYAVPHGDVFVNRRKDGKA